MQQVEKAHKKIGEYFFPLTFLINLFFLSEFFRTSEVFSYYQIPVIDRVLTYSFFLLVGALYAFLVTLLLILFQIILEFISPKRCNGLVPYGLLFIFQSLVFVNLFSLLIQSLGFGDIPLNENEIFWFALLVGIAIYLFRSKKIIDWYKEIQPLFSRIEAGVLVCIIPLMVYCFSDSFIISKNVSQVTKQVLERPNIILIIFDSLSAYDVSAYGYKLPTTPNITEFAKESTLYENAHVNTPSTLPSNTSILTGRYAYLNSWHSYGDLSKESAAWNNIPKETNKLDYENIKVFSSVQFHSPLINHVQEYYQKIYLPSFSSIPLISLLQDLTEGTRIRTNLTLTLFYNEYLSEFKIMAGDYDNGKNEEWKLAKHAIDKVNSDKPLFLQINAWLPHYPYVGDFTGEFLDAKYGLDTYQGQAVFIDKTYPDSQQPEIDKLRLRYDENILRADKYLGDFLKSLKDESLYDNSLIIITSDHGENFVKGNHGHSTYLMGAMEHKVPLLVKYPGQTNAAKVLAPVQLIDIFPTILDVLKVNNNEDFMGRSLLQINQNQDRPLYLMGLTQGNSLGNYRLAIVTKEFKYLNSYGATFLYNLLNDPYETRNVLEENLGLSYEFEGMIKRFSDRIDQFRENQEISGAPNLKELINEPKNIKVKMVVNASELNWVNVDNSFKNVFSKGKLMFGGESQRSYADLKLTEGITGIILKFQSPKEESIVCYLESLNPDSQRLDFKGIVADARLTQDGNWILFSILPQNTDSIRIAFKNAYTNELSYVENLDLKVCGE